MEQSADPARDRVSGAWILRIDIPDENVPSPRSNHQHVDVESPEAAAIYLHRLNDLVGPVQSHLEQYRVRWECPECRAWRLAPD